MSNPNPLFKALEARFESQRQNALATLHIYFTNSVGIGEHPQHLDEMAKLVDQLASAEDKIQSLRRNFDESGAVQYYKPMKAS